MDGLVDSPTIRPISKGVIHRICSGQVILDLSSAVKELVENSLDAGATSIEISLREYGAESIKVSDNGCGISPDNFQGLALKHHTSKIADFPDLQSLTSFGFRGEALSSLCALGDLTVETRTKNEPVGTHLTFGRSGLITCERKTARQIGTVVTVEKLFSTLPVRFKEFSRNIRREYGKLISLLNAYALIAKGVRLVCTNTTGRTSKSVVLKTQGSSSLKDNIISVFGTELFNGLEPLSLCLTGSIQVEGFLSKPVFGSRRTLGDRQFFYVNGRPVDMPKLSKVINEFYRSSNSRQYPIVIMNFTLPTKEFDVNVTPDKRKIFFSDENSLMLALREAIEKIYSPNHCSYSANSFSASKEEMDSFELHSPVEINALPKPSPEGSGEKGSAVCGENLISEDIPDCSKMVIESGWDSDEKTMIVHDKEENSLFNDLTGTENSESLQMRTSSFLNMKKDKHATFQARAVAKGFGEKLSSPAGSNLVQSSLANFLSVNKRKRENSSTLLSEMPVLRKELIPCQVKKSNSEVHPLAPHSGFITSPCGDPPIEASKKERLENFEAFHLSNEVKTSPSTGCNVNGGGSEQLPIYKFKTVRLGENLVQQAVSVMQPAEWWLAYGTECAPHLTRIAIRVLSHTCSSSNCERNWSTFSLIHTRSRNRLASKKLNDLVFLHYNMRLKYQNAKRRERTEYCPINLDNIYSADIVDDWIEEREDAVLDSRENDWMEEDLVRPVDEDDETQAEADPPRQSQRQSHRQSVQTIHEGVETQTEPDPIPDLPRPSQIERV